MQNAHKHICTAGNGKLLQSGEINICKARSYAVGVAVAERTSDNSPDGDKTDHTPSLVDFAAVMNAVIAPGFSAASWF